MKFFWKIFFTTMFISTICVTISGYILINSNFQSQLSNEIKTAQDYGEIVYYSLANEFEDGGVYTHAAAGENLDIAEDTLLQIVHSISINSKNQRVAFGIIDPNGNALFSSLGVALDKTIISSMDTQKAGWTLKETENEIYVQVMRPAIYLDSVFYIETLRDVTHVFTSQKSQYEMMIKVIAGMILFAGVLTFIISKLLLRRITALTEITKTISNGNLNERAKTHGHDEIALLSENFNQMADHLEEKMRELQDEAERKELFVGAFSHELKTPLTSIIGYSDLLRQKELTAEQRHICTEYIFSEGKRLETLSMRLLDLIVLKKHTFSPEFVEINMVLDEVAALIAPQLTATDIHLIYNVEQALIPMEVDLMKTVFINLIDNARKAIDGTGEIVLTGQRRQQDYVITIQDTGKGMEQQELSRITDAFYMVDKSRSRKQGGAGLGLAICNEILTLHGFDISFDSSVGIGTVVTVTMKEGDRCSG